MQVAVQYGYKVEVLEPSTPWKFAEGKLASKTQHSVPYEKIQTMKKRYEAGVGVDELIRTLSLEPVLNPLMRNIPPIAKASPEPQNLISFDEFSASSAMKWKQQETTPRKSPSKPQPSNTMSDLSVWETPAQPVEEDGSSSESKEAEVKEVPKKDDAKSQKKQRKNKQTQSPTSGLTPHRLSCPNENPSFTQIRELYPDVKDSYLWDFFEQCKGDADWCVNLLCDENLADQMESGSDLTCSCFGSDVTEIVLPAPKPAQLQSPAIKPKKSKAETSKQINLDDWLIAKEAIERSVTIGNEHYPAHVNMVRKWKQGPPPEPEVVEDQTFVHNRSPDVEDELHAVPIAADLILELDEHYGGGLLKSGEHEFPSKIFIKKSTAHLLYLEIMEAIYSQEEEARILTIKKDEELAKQLSELQVEPKKAPKGRFVELDEPENIALQMSKEKLVEIFPDIPKSDLMEIFSSNGFNFKDTVATIQDSLFCTTEERKEIAKKQKKAFNTPWQGSEDKPETKSDDDKDGYTSAHLKTIEDLRQEIQDHNEEQKVCYNKARAAIQSKNYELATYLSNIATFHKSKSEEARHEVANMMANIHEKTQASNTTLDLHFLNLIEAATLLDTFLDKNISRLRAVKKPYTEVNIITGRGAHSINGVSTIKNKTKSRLRERNLK